MTGIVDYNAGNIRSVERALAALGAPYVLSKNPRDLEGADRLIFPGVGEAKYAMEQLAATGFDGFLRDWARAGKPLLGICLGSQIIFEHSEEGDIDCLGILKGEIKHFKTVWAAGGTTAQDGAPAASGNADSDSARAHAVAGSAEAANASTGADSGAVATVLKVPHMGWNDLAYTNGGSRLFAGVAEHADFYFVHSYLIQPADASIIKATADYGCAVPACVESGSVTAFQFHPEKSGAAGLQVLRNFVEGASC